jgi:hypothetical protein
MTFTECFVTIEAISTGTALAMPNREAKRRFLFAPVKPITWNPFQLRPSEESPTAP